MRRTELTKKIVGVCDECGKNEEITKLWYRFIVKDDVQFKSFEIYRKDQSLYFNERTVDLCSK